MDKTSTPSGPVATMADVRRGGDVVFFFSLFSRQEAYRRTGFVLSRESTQRAVAQRHGV